MYRRFSNVGKAAIILFAAVFGLNDLSGQTLTIISSGETGSSGTNWSITGNTLQVTGTASIRASVVASHLANNDLSIVGNTTSFVVTVSEAITVASGSKSLTIGSATNTGNITIGAAVSLNGALTAYGGIITLNANITSTLSGSAVLLKATDQVNTAGSLTFTTNNGDFILWSDSDNSSGGRIWLGNNNVINTANGSTGSGLSGGGKIVLAGGLDDGSNGGTASDGIPDGFAANANSTGVYLGSTTANYTQMYSGGGDILVRGASTFASYSNSGNGVSSEGRWLANAGKGSITVHGTSGWFYGINFSNPASNTTSGDKHLQLISDKASGTAISITGTGSIYHGVVFNFINPKEVLATGGGAIVINGTGGNFGPGVYLQNTDILATSGDITVNGSGSGTAGIFVGSYGARFGSRTGTDITSSTSNIRWSVNSMTLEGLTTGFTNNFTTTGTATIEPSGTSFASAVTVPISNFTIASTVTGLTIGKTTNTANVTVSGAISLSAPIAIYGGTVAINAAVTATGSTLTVGASTSLTQSAAITAGSLLLTGAGTFTLTGSSNDVGTIAGGTSGSRLGSLSYTEASGALTIGTVGSTSGIYATGTIQVETLTGNINLTQPVSSSSTSTNAVIINAGKNAAALTASGGDIIVSGSPTVTVGSGGVGKLFSGLAIYSTGLTTLVGGSANVRNGFDESSSISPALSGNTNYAIYRATLGVGDLTIVASGGDALSSYKWIYDNGVISTAASTVSINASDLVSYLGTGNLTIEAGHVTISSAITSSASNAFVINSNGVKTITVNAALSLGGPLTFNGYDVAMGDGIGISTSTASNITINTTVNFYTNGTTRRTISSAGGNITIHADSDASGGGDLNLDYLTLDPGVGNVIIRGKTFGFSTTPADKPFIRGTGTFILEPSDATFVQDMQTDWFKLDEVGHIKSGVTFGKVGNTSNFSLNHVGGLTVAGPFTVYGSFITNSTPLTSSATGNIFFKGLQTVSNTSTITKSGGTGTFTMQSNSMATNSSTGVITTSGSGVLNVVLWSDFDNSNNDGGTGHAGTISTNGGHVWLGGSNSNGGSYTWNGITVGDGPSIGVGGFYNAYALDLMGSVTTNGGDFLAWAGSAPFTGIGNDGSGDIVSVGTGDIVLITDALTGSGVNPIYFTQSGGTFTLVPDGGSFASAFDWNPTVSTVLSGTNDDYKLGSGNFPYLGIGDMNSISRLTIGYFNGMSSGSTPVEFTNSSNITISSATSLGGSFSLYGGTVALNNNITSTASGDISIYTDAALAGLSSTRTITTSGSFKYIPKSASFSSAVSFPITNLTLTNVTGVEVGKSGNTANLNIVSDLSVAGYITMYAGPVSLAANLTTTGSGDINIYSNASLSATGSRTATAAGLFKYMPDGTSFSSAVSYPIGNLTVSSNGLQLGKAGNTAAMTITGAASSNGPVTVYTGDFTTDASATLTATGSALEVNASGNVTLNAALAGSTTTVNGQGNVRTTGSLTNLNLSGGNGQSITGTATLTNLTVNKSAGTATVAAGPQNVTGVLTLSSGTLAAGGNLTLKSSSSGTARVAQHATGTGTVTGNVVVERHIPGSRKMQWRMLAFPYNAAMALSGVSGIKINYTTPQTMMFFNEGQDNLLYGNSGNRNGGYESFTSSGQTVAVGQGVMAWIYGDASTSTAPSNGTLGATALTMSSQGVLNETGADVSIPVTNNAQGWNLVGNPFASTIDWELFRTATGSSNLSATLYRWDPEAANWTTFNIDGTVTGNGSRYIESGAAFFVKSAAPSPAAISLTIPQSAKVTEVPTNLHFGRAPWRLDLPQERMDANRKRLAGLRLKASGMGNPIPGEAYVDVSKPDATKGWDPRYDALMMSRSSGANVYLDGERDEDFTVNFDAPLPLGGKRQYPLTVTSPAAGRTTLEIASEGDWNPLNSVSLIDTREGKTILMQDGRLSHTFTMPSIKEEGRFILAINHVAIDKDGGVPGRQLRILGNPVTGERIDLLLAHPTAKPKRWELSTMQGANVAEGRFEPTEGNVQYGLQAPGMRASGVYVLRVEMDNGEVQTVQVMRK